MSERLNQSTEDYLKTIYDLTCAGEPASTTHLAGALGVRPASVTGMVQKMAQADPPLVDYHKHYGVKLTEHGKRRALEIIRHHRLLETYLFTVLGYAWDEVHREACRLEHAISGDFAARIDAALGYPRRDPHGAPIPGGDLSLPDEHPLALASLRKDESAIIQRVADDNPALLRHLGEIGLVPGACVSVTGYSELDGNLTIQVAGQASPVVVGMAVSSQVFIDPLHGRGAAAATGDEIPDH